MKVLFFVDDFVGGAGNVIQIIALALAKRNYKVTVALTRPSTSPRRQMDGVSIVYLNRNWQKQKKHMKYIKMILEIKEIIIKTRPDVVISFLFGVSSLVGLCCPKYIPLIVSERSNPLIIHPSIPWKYLRRHAYKKAAAVVILFDEFSIFDDERYCNKTVTIPNPVEIPTSIHRRKVGEDGIFRFATLGNDRPVKGFKYLIEGFAITVKRYPNSILTIYGKKLSEENIALVKKLCLTDKVILAGYTSDVYKSLANEDFYIMTSLQEGFPNSLCEAMAFGMPCAASLCHDGIKRIIVNGYNGLTFTSGKVDEIAIAMNLLIENPQKSLDLGRQAMEITRSYNIEKVVSYWEQLIKNVIRKE